MFLVMDRIPGLGCSAEGPARPALQRHYGGAALTSGGTFTLITYTGAWDGKLFTFAIRLQITERRLQV